MVLDVNVEVNPAIFKEGDPVNFIDTKDRYYLDTLKVDGETNIRGARLMHNDVIGQHDGFRLDAGKGVFDVFRPTLVESVLKMPRAATIIYPKDLGLVLVWGDIYPGATVIEAGIGSGAMAITLLRAIGEKGKLISYELREDFKNCARKNVRTYYGEAKNHELKSGDIYLGIEEKNVDRIVLDVPEPWQVVPHAAESLRDGGIFISYSPTMLQVKETVDTLIHSRAFSPSTTLESILRPWEINGRSVRPDLQIVGHTGFLTFARKRRQRTRGSNEDHDKEQV